MDDSRLAVGLEALVRSVAGADSAPEIFQILINGLPLLAPRAAVFLVGQKDLQGWRSIGYAEMVQQLLARYSASLEQVGTRIDLDGKPDLRRGFGPGPNFGQPVPLESAAVTVCVKGKPIALIVIERSPDEGPWHPAGLAMVVRVARLRLELSLAERKLEREGEPSSSYATTARPTPARPAPARPAPAAARPNAAASMAGRPAPIVTKPAPTPASTVAAPVPAPAPAMTRPASAPASAPAMTRPAAPTASPMVSKPSIMSSPTVSKPSLMPAPTVSKPNSLAPSAPTPATPAPAAPAAAKPAAPVDPKQQAAVRYARLIASDIRLYNEQAVKLGVANGDLGARLRQDIAVARESFDKRYSVLGEVADDIFYDALVDILAGGDTTLLPRF